MVGVIWDVVDGGYLEDVKDGWYNEDVGYIGNVVNFGVYIPDVGVRV